MSSTDPDIVAAKVPWTGVVLAIQPRIRLARSNDERNHSYQGYALLLRGRVAGREREFSVGIGKAAQEKFALHAGDEITGAALPVMDARLENVEFYKVSALKLVYRSVQSSTPPPWLSVPPPLGVYRERGHRRLDAQTYEDRCRRCIWGCRMPVEIIVDQWKPKEKEYRFETFCYGPKSCSLYRAGAARKVPRRNGTEWEEPDSVDEEATGHRAPDE